MSTEKEYFRKIWFLFKLLSVTCSLIDLLFCLYFLPSVERMLNGANGKIFGMHGFPPLPPDAGTQMRTLPSGG